MIEVRDVRMPTDEREQVRQAQLDYWRGIPWMSHLIDQDAEFEAGEKEIWHGGEGRAMCAVVERILAARLTDAFDAGMLAFSEGRGSDANPYRSYTR